VVKMALRLGKETFGTKDINEVCQKAFEPYFQEEISMETILNEQKEEEK
jgi:hypothetical protein